MRPRRSIVAVALVAALGACSTPEPRQRPAGKHLAQDDSIAEALATATSAIVKNPYSEEYPEYRAVSLGDPAEVRRLAGAVSRSLFRVEDTHGGIGWAPTMFADFRLRDGRAVRLLLCDEFFKLEELGGGGPDYFVTRELADALRPWAKKVAVELR